MANESIYRSVLEAALPAVQAVLTPQDGWSVKLRKEPRLDTKLDKFPCCIIAPRRDLMEVVVKLTFSNIAVLGYTVFVGIFTDERIDLDQLWKRMTARQNVRLALWEPKAMGLDASLGEFDVDFDAMGLMGEMPPANVDGGWMSFRYDFKTSRSSGG